MQVTNKRKIATTEMRMLRGILGVSRRDQMRNEEIRRILQLAPIDEVIRSGRLRWFGHAQIRDENNVTPQCDSTWYQTTRAPRRRNDATRPRTTWWAWVLYTGYGPRPEEVKKDDRTDIYDTGKDHQKEPGVKTINVFRACLRNDVTSYCLARWVWDFFESSLCFSL